MQFPFLPSGFLSIGLGRCDCRGASGPEKSQYLVALKSLVCERRAGLDTRQQGYRLLIRRDLPVAGT